MTIQSYGLWEAITRCHEACEQTGAALRRIEELCGALDKISHDGAGNALLYKNMETTKECLYKMHEVFESLVELQKQLDYAGRETPPMPPRAAD